MVGMERFVVGWRGLWYGGEVCGREEKKDKRLILNLYIGIHDTDKRW